MYSFSSITSIRPHQSFPFISSIFSMNLETSFTTPFKMSPLMFVLFAVAIGHLAIVSGAPSSIAGSSQDEGLTNSRIHPVYQPSQRSHDLLKAHHRFKPVKIIVKPPKKVVVKIPKKKIVTTPPTTKIYSLTTTAYIKEKKKLSKCQLLREKIYG